MKTLVTSILLVMAIEFHLMSAQPPPPVAAVKTNIQYLDARPILETLREDLLPAELRAMTPAERESAWPGWVSRHDATIRTRLEHGDEESVVNFLLFGTTFTKLARATERDLAQLAGQPSGVPDLIVRRIEDELGRLRLPDPAGLQGFDRLRARDLPPARAVREEDGLRAGVLPEGPGGPRAGRGQLVDGRRGRRRELVLAHHTARLELAQPGGEHVRAAAREPFVQVRIAKRAMHELPDDQE